MMPLKWAMSFIKISQIYQSVAFYLVCIFYTYCIIGVMAKVFEVSVVDRAFEPSSD